LGEFFDVVDNLIGMASDGRLRLRCDPMPPLQSVSVPPPQPSSQSHVGDARVWSYVGFTDTIAFLPLICVKSSKVNNVSSLFILLRSSALWIGG
jgi:hypothetical protein